MNLWGKFLARVTTQESHPLDRRFWRFIIVDRDSDAPYLVRWSMKLWRGYIIRLHIILRPDAVLCAHDHPWDFWTWCVWGGYAEIVEWDELISKGATRRRREMHRVRPLGLYYRPSKFRHTITKVFGGRAITIVLTGPKKNTWGFWTQWGWKRYTDFLAHNGAVRALWCRDL